MKWNKANLAGLTSPGQQSEMKAILAGTWPPLKPLPVFKYETAEYRATIDFDKKRGEWVCRKTSLPSNEVQELRGGLREITLALPHGEVDIFTEGADPQEQELERETNRRLQAIREWREKFENGGLYFELREFLSESQRTELDDSLRLSLTARQLQFNSRNAANVFDDLSIAGGRFAALIEFAKRNKSKQGTDTSAQEEVTLPEAESASDPDTIKHDEHSLVIGLPEFRDAFNNNDPVVQEQETAEWYARADEFPALSIKNVFPEQELTSLAERTGHAASQQFEIETSEIADEELPSLAELSHHEAEEERHSPVFESFAAQIPTGQPFEDRIAGSTSRLPVFKISAFHANIFAILFLFAATAFTVGLTVGRGPLGKRFREAPKSLLAADAKPPAPALPDLAQPDASDESSSQTRTLPAAASSDDSVGAKKPGDAAAPEEKPTASEEKSNEIARGPGLADVRPANSDSSPTKESASSVEPEVNPEPASTIGPVARNMSPPASHKLVRPSSKRLRRHKVVSKAVSSSRSVPRSPAPYRLASAIAATPHTASAAPYVPRSSTILVTVPDRGSQPFRVSFPNKTIAATSSLAMTSQLSVLVPPEPKPAVAPKSARLEAGELVSFGWPRYSSSGRSGLAETIRVRATIGQLGQVQEIKFLSGSALLLPATTEAIRQWRYTPTLLDMSPVQTQQDITIEFRPPQYSARMSTQRSPHN